MIALTPNVCKASCLSTICSHLLTSCASDISWDYLHTRLPTKYSFRLATTRAHEWTYHSWTCFRPEQQWISHQSILSKDFDVSKIETFRAEVINLHVTHSDLNHENDLRCSWPQNQLGAVSRSNTWFTFHHKKFTNDRHEVDLYQNDCGTNGTRTHETL